MIKTVTLSGAEQIVTGLERNNTLVINNSSAPVYASSKPNIEAFADGVIEIPAGARDTVIGTNGTVYLLGSGRVEVRGVDYVGFSKPSSSSGGGGGTSDVTKTYVDTQDSSILGTAKSYTDTAVNAVKADVTENADDIVDLQTDLSAAQSAITTNSTAIATVQTAAANAKSAADSAQTTADTAQTAAETAQTAAENAQSAADSAQTTADAAQTAAASAQSAAEEAQTTADAAQAAADTNAANITTTAAATLENAKTYTDTKTSALDTRVAATETAITTLNGMGAGSVTKAVADGIADVVAGAPESFDTLKEISDWISSHSDSAAAMNTQIQTNSTDISALQTTKADKSEIPTTLPANGGNANTVNEHTVNADVPENAVFTDTVYSLPAATKTALGGVKVGDNLSVAADGTLSAPIYSNPNLLDNPDFKINQRGVSGTITAAGYFVDRWKLKSGSVTINANKTLTLNGTIEQILETAAGANVTASSNAGVISYNNSTKTVALTGQNVTVSWAKLELGNTETPFVPPSPSAELAKCMYYYERRAAWVHRASGIYSFAFAGIVFAAPKRVAPTVKLLKLWHDGNSASEQFFKDITTANVAVNPLDPLFSSTWSISITVTTGAIESNDFTYQMLYEASADL